MPLHTILTKGKILEPFVDPKNKQNNFKFQVPFLYHTMYPDVLRYSCIGPLHVYYEKNSYWELLIAVVVPSTCLALNLCKPIHLEVHKRKHNLNAVILYSRPTLG